MIQYLINRGGKKISPLRRQDLEHAGRILQRRLTVAREVTCRNVGTHASQSTFRAHLEAAGLAHRSAKDGALRTAATSAFGYGLDNRRWTDSPGHHQPGTVIAGTTTQENQDGF